MLFKYFYNMTGKFVRPLCMAPRENAYKSEHVHERALNLMAKASCMLTELRIFNLLSRKRQSHCIPMLVLQTDILRPDQATNEQSIAEYNCRPFTEQLHSFSEVLYSWPLLYLQMQLNQKVWSPNWTKQTVNFLKHYFKTVDTISLVQIYFGAGSPPN